MIAKEVYFRPHAIVTDLNRSGLLHRVGRGSVQRLIPLQPLVGLGECLLAIRHDAQYPPDLDGCCVGKPMPQEGNSALHKGNRGECARFYQPGV